jgi:hypothetical protein
MIAVSGLSQGRSRSKMVVLIALGSLIAAAAWFVLSRM